MEPWSPFWRMLETAGARSYATGGGVYEEGYVMFQYLAAKK